MWIIYYGFTVLLWIKNDGKHLLFVLFVIRAFDLMSSIYLITWIYIFLMPSRSLPRSVSVSANFRYFLWEISFHLVLAWFEAECSVLNASQFHPFHSIFCIELMPSSLVEY